METRPIHILSTATITPPPRHSPSPRRWELTPLELSMFNIHYHQNGHLFSLPSVSDDVVGHILASLKSSLSLALGHFYPLAGRLFTTTTDNGLYTHVDCNDQGAEFIHAVAADNLTASDVVGAADGDLPSDFLRLLFPYDGAIGYDGHTIPLLAVQLTQFSDGIFLGCSFNHVVGDGISLWHFFNTWAEICRGKDVSRPPVLERWFPEGTTVPIRMPFKHPDEYIERHEVMVLRERMFHFSAPALAALKLRANRECNMENKISSFQALSALLWRSISRLRRLPEHRKTSCCLAIENRSRVSPRLSPDYFGNAAHVIMATATQGELLAHDLGWAAMLLNRSVAAHTDEAIRGAVGMWLEMPFVYKASTVDNHSVMMGSSPRFDMYGCDFGWGKAVALRSGGANKMDGKVSAYPGRDGDGSVDLEVCLTPEHMTELLLDVEFMSIVSSAL